jgi:ribosome-binding protein aMBF1 (putative translation factor)
MKITSGSSVGSALRRARLDFGMSQSDLASMINIYASALNKVEHDKAGFDTAWIPLMPPEIRVAVKTALAREVENIPVNRLRRRDGLGA